LKVSGIQPSTFNLEPVTHFQRSKAMPFDHKRYNSNFIRSASGANKPVNVDPKFGVRIVEADVAPGETYWKVVGVHHLLPEENFSKHNIYIEALDEQGNRLRNPFAWAGWTWEGRRPNERADPVPLDKPDNETGGDIAIHFGQKASVWIKGQNRDADEKSDRVENLHTAHPDEPLPDGRLLNTLGHHSFYVVFQRTRKEAQTAPVSSTPIPATPPPTPPVPTPPSPPAPPMPTPPPPPPTPQPQPQPQPQAPAKSINHYVLFGPPNSRGRQTTLLLALNYILAFSPTVGFSLEEAKQARQVTIIGEGISLADQQALRNAGAQVEVLAGDPYEIEARLNARIRAGRAFGG
jgi:hypothetical protein